MTSNELTYRQRILRVQVYIQENLDGDLSLDRLARVACFSPYHFHRVFRGLVGESVYEYVRRLRLESAAMALKNTAREIVRIAFDAGYGTHEAFTRAFGQLFGVSPSQYRAGKRPAPQPPEVSAMTATVPEVRIEPHPPRRVLFIRHVGPYGSVGPTFQKLMGYAFQRGLFRQGTQVMAIYHDDPDVTPTEKQRCDCAITVGDDVTANGEFGIQSIDGGEFAVTTHRGPYDTLPTTYRGLFGSWLPASGREPRHSPPFEIYRNNPMDTKPEDLLTDIYLPLALK